ncbi:MAG TPA: fumarylacetoacetate hydrolase family protein [Beijerinckiaceae bacterium]
MAASAPAALSPLAARIVEARRTGAPAPWEPGLAAADLATAFRDQAAVAQALGARIAGWKVGFLQDGVTAWGAPIYAQDMIADGGTYALKPGQTVKVEAELGVRFARDLPKRAQPYTREDVLAAVGELFCGLELVWSRFANVDDVPFVSRVADSFSNGTYTIGSCVTSFAGLDLATLPCRLTIAGSVANDRRGGHANGDPMTPLVAWANVQADHLGGMRAGQFLTLGTLNTPVPVSGAAEIEATLEGIGAARLSLR